MQKKDTIFLYGGFHQHNYLYLLPLLKGYLKNKKVRNIIIEKKLAKEIFRKQILLNFLKKLQCHNIERFCKKKNFCWNIY